MSIEFNDQGGVQRRSDQLEVIQAPDAFLKLLDKIYYELKHTGGEVLFNNANNRLTPMDALQSELRLRKAGIKMRFLVRENDTHLHFL